MCENPLNLRCRPPTRLIGLLAIPVLIWVIVSLIRCSKHSGAPALFPGEAEARQMGEPDLRTLELDEDTAKTLRRETGLSSLKSRGATIFVDEKGSIRVPPSNILVQMEFRDLEELYHRYLESVQVKCNNQVHLGSLFDGGYDLCNDNDVIPVKPCVAYSFGVRDDFSFDDELSMYYGCNVHSFDPANGMSDHAHSDTVYFHSLGLGKKDEVTKDKWILKTFSSVRKDLNHSEKELQVVKIDIESAEWSALEEMLASDALMGVKQLIMEFHSWVYLPPWIVNSRNKKDYIHHLNVLRGLYEQGFRIFYFKRFPANCCIYKDEFGIIRDGCLEVHLMRVL